MKKGEKVQLIIVDDNPLLSGRNYRIHFKT